MASEQRIAKLKDLLQNDPHDSFSRYALALEYNGMGDPYAAIDELKELIKQNAKYVAAYHQLGQLYGKLNKTSEAKKIYRKGIDVATEMEETKEIAEMREELEELEDEW